MKHLMIKVSNLEYSYPGATKVVIQEFSSEIHSGEILGIIGKNGVGKSTMMRLLASLHQPQKGSITINGIDSQDIKNRRDYILNFVYIAHDKVPMSDYSLRDYCKIYSCFYPDYSKQVEEDLINHFNFECDEKFSSLSTGNKMKYFIIFALATKVPLILIDELTAVLDPENREDFFELTKTYKAEGISFVIATNLVDDLTQTADRIWFIDKGHITEEKVENLHGLFKKRAS